MNLLKFLFSNGGKIFYIEYILYGYWNIKLSGFYGDILGVVFFLLFILFINLYFEFEGF